MRAYVSCTRSTQNGVAACVLTIDGGKLHSSELSIKMLVNVGEVIEYGGSKAVADKAEIVDDEQFKREIEKAVDRICKSVSNKHYETGIKDIDKATSRMWSALSGSASVLLRKIALGAPIIVRFHNDIDGATGSYALYKAVQAFISKTKTLEYMNMTWLMHRSIAYSATDASTDTMIANNYSSIEKPLLVIIDFGTSADSNSGVERIKDRFDILWFDHHPIEEAFKGKALEHYINPWAFDGDSNYTAGFLMCAFSKTISDIDTHMIENASFIGDYSSYNRQDGNAKELALILDLITSDVKTAFYSFGDNLTPANIDTILNDKAKSKELATYARERMYSTVESAVKSAKRYDADGYAIFTIDFGRVRDAESKYPLPGRFASGLLERVCELSNKPCIVISHFNSYISIRCDKRLESKIDLARVIVEMKNDYVEIESGGGHKFAASIKLSNEGRKNAIIKKLVDRLKGS